MNGVVTKLGFTIWAKNMSERAFNGLHRDLIKSDLLARRANGSFRGFMRSMSRETRAARGFGTVLMTSVLGPLAASAGVFGAAAVGIAGVGAAMGGMMLVGIMAADKLQKKFDSFKEYKKDLKATFDESFSSFMDRIAPNFLDALEQMKKSMGELSPIFADMFNDLAPMTAPLLKAMTELAKVVLPAIGRLFEAVGPHMVAFVDSFSGLAGLIDNIGASLDKLAPSINPIIEDIIEVAGMILGPQFFGALAPLIDGLHGFFEAAKPGFFKFLGDFATALNNLAPVLPALGDFLGRVLTAAGPVLISLSESLADKLPSILNGLAGFAEFLGTILDNKAVTDVLVDIGMAYLVIAGALKAINTATAVTTLLTLGHVPGGLPGLGKGAAAPGAPKPMGKLSSGWSRWATRLGTLLSRAVKIAFVAGLVLWGADELSQALTGESLGDDFLGVRKKFNQTYKDEGFWKALWEGVSDKVFPDDIFNPTTIPNNPTLTGQKDPNASGQQTLSDPEIEGKGFKKGKGIQSDPSNPQWMREYDKNIDDLFGNWGDNLSHLMKNFRQFWINLKKNLDNAWANMQAWFSKVGENIKTWLMNLGKNISGTVDNVVQWFQNIWTNLSRGINNVKQWFANLSTNIANTWKNIRVGIHNAWVWVLNNVIYKIRDFFTKTIPMAASVLRVKVIQAWERLKDGVRAAKDWIFDKVVSPIKNFFTKTIPNAADTMAKKVKEAFNKAKTWVGEVWSKLGGVVKAPVNWVIKNVYNNGIRALWNKVASAVGQKGLPEVKLIGGDSSSGSAKEATKRMLTAKGMAKGGPVFGGPPGVDTVPANLNNGEHVLTTDEVRRAGGHGNIMKFRSALMGGRPVQGANGTGFFEGGGFWDKVKSIPGKLFDNDFVRGALGSVAGPIVDSLKGFIGDMPGDTGLGKLAKGVATKPLDWIMDWIGKDDEKHSALLDGGAGLYQSMFSWIKARVPGVSLMSGLRQGDPGYHGSGKAVDLGFSDRSEYGPGMHGMANKAFNLIKKTFKPNIAELIWDFAGSKAVWNGNDHFFTGSGAGPGTHNNHIHWAMARAASGVSAATSGYSGGGASAWRGVVNGVLNELGIDRSNAANVLRAIQKESGGNPRAINNWDSNAAAGIPSKGLLQTIDPTFNAWAGKYKSRGVYDPYANIYAAVRYARNRYGSGWSARMAQPGGYANGTMSADPGWHWVGERGRELVNFGGGERVIPNAQSEKMAGGGDVHVHFHDKVYGDKRAVTEVVIAAVHEAKRDGRI